MEFPKNHYNHPDLKTEWWYFAGRGELDRIATNYHLCFFRKFSSKLRKHIYFAHFGLNVNGEFKFKQKTSDHANSDNAILQVFVDNWDLHRAGRDHYVTVLDEGTSLVHIARKKPAIHTPGYYSITDMDVRGTIDGEIFRGKGWFDHEFKDSSALDLLQSKYYWFALQLDKGIEIMLYVMPKAPATSLGTITFPGGETRRIIPGDYCLKDGPNLWTLELPVYGITVDLHKKADFQIIGNLGADYTEGTFDIVTRGKIGQGFFEITEGLGIERGD